MNIKHSRRLLVIGAPESGTLDVIKDLTGSAPTPSENGSTAGLTHEWEVKTAYYSAKVPIWVDEITSVSDWKAEFLKPEAKEVVEVVGAWVYCFRTSTGDGPGKEVEETVKAIQEIVEEHAGYGADSVMLAVAMPSSMASSSSGVEGVMDAEWEDMCLGYGFEYVDYRAKGTNEFGEKTGFERLKEALEANEWAASVNPDTASEIDELDALDLSDTEDAFTHRDEAEMTAELFGMKAALAGAEDLEEEFVSMHDEKKEEREVEDLDRLMGRLLAVKEQGADLPEAQRKRMAARAVRELMGEAKEGEGEGKR